MSTRDDRLAGAVRRALKTNPASGRALAREAGLGGPTVSRVRLGRRAPTADTAAAIADALDRWSVDCGAAAEAIRRELDR